MRFAVQTIAVCPIAAPTFAQAPSPAPRADYHDEQLDPDVNVFPDEQPAKIVRRGIAACGPDGQCTFTLLLPQDTRPPKK